MNTKKLLLYSLVLSALFMFTACKKDNDDTNGGQSKRVVKFEITGNYTGKLLVAYTNASGGTESLTVNALPWTKEITYNNTVAGIGIGGGTDVPNVGVAGQTVTVKIFSAGKVVVIGTPAVANANGVVNLPSLAYAF